MAWITLNDVTLRIEEILSIEMNMVKNDPIFMVTCKTLKPLRIRLESTGGKWLYMQCQKGIEEARKGGAEYGRL